MAREIYFRMQARRGNFEAKLQTSTCKGSVRERGIASIIIEKSNAPFLRVPLILHQLASSSDSKVALIPANVTDSF